MKRLLLSLIFLASLQSLSAWETKIPRHEFNIYAGGSTSGWMVSGPNICNVQKGAPRNTWDFGLGYSWNFHKNWAFTTGIGVQTLVDQNILFDGEIAYLTYPGGRPKLTSCRTIDMENPVEKEPGGQVSPYFMEVYVPLMATFKLPLFKNVLFYTSAGASVGYIVEAGGQGYFRPDEYRVISQGDKPSDFTDTGWKSMDVKNYNFYDDELSANPLELSGRLECGFRIPVWKVTGIYFGFYGAMGLTPIFKNLEQPMPMDIEQNGYSGTHILNAVANTYCDETVVVPTTRRYMSLRYWVAGLRLRIAF